MPAITVQTAKRRKAILDVAWEIFLEHGYADTSMSMIAAKVGGSKATLYGYFTSKEDLFRAVAEHQCHVWSDEVFSLALEGDVLSDRLQVYGENMLEIVVSDRFMAFHRLISAESTRFPDIGKTYYQACVRYGFEHLGSYLAEAMNAGELRRADPMLAAEYLNDIIQSGMFRRRIFNVIAPPTRVEIAVHVRESVRLFLHGFAPQAAMTSVE